MPAPAPALPVFIQLLYLPEIQTPRCCGQGYWVAYRGSGAILVGQGCAIDLLRIALSCSIPCRERHLVEEVFLACTVNGPLLKINLCEPDEKYLASVHVMLTSANVTSPGPLFVTVKFALCVHHSSSSFSEVGLRSNVVGVTVTPVALFTVQLRLAGVGSVVPVVGSISLTWKVCEPLIKPV